MLFLLAAALLTWSGISLAAADSAPEPATSSSNVGGQRAASPATPVSPAQSSRWSLSRPEKVAVAPAKVARTSARRAPDAESIRIPVLGIDQDLVELGVVGTALQVPDRYSDVGWWSDGPRPGEKGAAVMVGHVDSLTGPAVFYQLSGLQAGDRVVVGRVDGSRMVYAVRRVRAYGRNQFPSAQVYRSHGAPALHLVTCGGTFDSASGHYTSNVVVFAPLVKRVPAPAADAKPQWYRTLVRHASEGVRGNQGEQPQ